MPRCESIVSTEKLTVPKWLRRTVTNFWSCGCVAVAFSVKEEALHRRSIAQV